MCVHACGYNSTEGCSLALVAPVSSLADAPPVVPTVHPVCLPRVMPWHFHRAVGSVRRPRSSPTIRRAYNVDEERNRLI